MRTPSSGREVSGKLAPGRGGHSGAAEPWGELLWRRVGSKSEQSGLCRAWSQSEPAAVRLRRGSGTGQSSQVELAEDGG